MLGQGSLSSVVRRPSGSGFCRVCRPAVRPSPGALRPSVGPGPPQAPGCLRPPGHCPRPTGPATLQHLVIPPYIPPCIPPSYPLHMPFLAQQQLPCVYAHHARVPHAMYVPMPLAWHARTSMQTPCRVSCSGGHAGTPRMPPWPTPSLAPRRRALCVGGSPRPPGHPATHPRHHTALFWGDVLNYILLN